jgi:peptidoglycan/LPS O-acetylase OafA/YrhL
MHCRWNQKDGQACYGHSWYLANDMQFFLLVPFFVMLYRKGYKKAAIAAVCSCMLTCIIASWTLAIQHSWSPNIWDGAEGDRARNEGFSRPWVRCCSYMIGILFSFYWYHKKQFHPDHKFSGAQVCRRAHTALHHLERT